MWKQINNSHFYVNEKGEVKSVDRLICSHKGNTQYQRLQRGKILKGGVTLKGYEFVTLEDGKHYFRHQLVAQYFIPNPNGYTEVNHKDENPHNNSVDNLEWCTHKENCNYGRRKFGNQDKAKKVAKYSIEGELIQIYNSLAQAEKENNCPKAGGIGKCCRGKQKTYKNFIYKYYKD